MPPIEYRSITKNELLRKYLDERWPEKLQEKVQSGVYQYHEYVYSTKTTKHWKHGNDFIVIVNEYINGQVVVRQLREDILYFIP